MRIIAGKYRHRLISYPENNPNIRPTKDRIREAIFSVIGNIEGKIGLDLYAGSGAMGLEALSREAKKIYFNDVDKKAYKVIEDNLKSLAVPNEDYELSLNSDFMYLDLLKQRGIKFDIVFIDPPYKLGQYDKLLSLLKNEDMLNPSSIIVLEHNTLVNIDENDYKKIKQYHYGEIFVTILWR